MRNDRMTPLRTARSRLGVGSRLRIAYATIGAAMEKGMRQQRKAGAR
jgi:hypothetical protein